MKDREIVLPRIFPPRVMTLTFGWAILTFQLVVLGVTLMASIGDVMSSFGHWLTGVAFFLYVCFIAPYSLTRVASAFLKSALSRESTAASLGLVGSIAGVCGWIALLARDLSATWNLYP